jgi:hypothetical protein
MRERRALWRITANAAGANVGEQLLERVSAGHGFVRHDRLSTAMVKPISLSFTMEVGFGPAGATCQTACKSGHFMPNLSRDGNDLPQGHVKFGAVRFLKLEKTRKRPVNISPSSLTSRFWSPPDVLRAS